MDETRRQQILKRLERKRQFVNARLEQKQLRINEQFDRKEAKISHSLNKKQAEIINAALMILDHEGLNNLSLRKLASELGMQAPALYWHFKSKELLIDYMAEEILRREFDNLLSRQGDTPWQDWLIGTCKRLRSAMSSYRDGGRVVAGAHLDPAITLMNLFEVSQEALFSAGVDERQGNLIVATAIHFTFGRVIEEQSSPTLEDLEQSSFAELSAQFPRIARNAKQMMEDKKNGYDDFDAALRLIIR